MKKIKFCAALGNLYERRKLLDKFCSGNDVKVFKFDFNASAEYVRTIVHTIDLFEEYSSHVYVLNHFPNFESKNLERWENMLSKIPENHVLIFSGNSHKKDGLNIPNDILNYIKKHGKIFTFNNTIEKKKAEAWITEVVQEHKKTIDEEDVELFIELVARGIAKVSVDGLWMAITKLIAYVGSNRKISRSDIESVFITDPENSIWKLFSCLDKQDIDSSMKIMYELFFSAKKGESLSYLMNICAWRYRLLFFIKELSSTGLNKEEIIESLTNHKKITSGQPTYTENQISAIMRGYGRSPIQVYSLNQLRKINYIMNESFQKVRDSSSKEEMINCMVIFVFACCNVLPNLSWGNMIRSHKIDW